MGYLKTIAAGAGIVGALAVTGLGLATGVANADAPSTFPAPKTSIPGGFSLENWGFGPGPGWGGGPGYGYNGACAWIPPFVSQWIPPAACGG
jgi:hypothetical protein